MAWFFLAGAIVLEVFGTASLRMSIKGSRAWYLAVAAGYVLSFVCLARTLALGLPLGIAYGIWAAIGVALTAVVSRVLFKEPLTILMGLGIVLVMGGVLLVELGAH